MIADFQNERASVDARLREICERRLPHLPDTLARAAAYGLSGKGKRLRPVLLQLAYRACRGDRDVSLLSCAPEVIHAYSLMHDDLPCMDDDDLRRGEPTVHKVFGPRATIVAGIALIPIAVEVATDGAKDVGATPETGRKLVRVLLEAAGGAGMIAGQAEDLCAEGEVLSFEAQEEIHLKKTGALIVASLQMGAIAAGASQGDVEAFGKFGQAIGLAFQIMDDVLDVTSTTGTMGKSTGRDAVLKKSTYPALLGVSAARDRARSLAATAISTLSTCGLLTPELTQVANFMVTRTS